MQCSRRLRRVDGGGGGRRLGGRVLRGEVVDHEEADDSHDDDGKRDHPNAGAFGFCLLVHGSSCDPSQVEVGFTSYCVGVSLHIATSILKNQAQKNILKNAL